ncbi:MAG: hypothetical protein LUH55_09340 [Bacteroides thetaiotaomicron]|nr:hypothetical protein [Bacteroides thetaiotaomicron]
MGATLAVAVWLSELYTGNEYRVQKYKTSLEKAFDAPDNWQPGVTIQREFWVSNNVSDADSEDTPVFLESVTMNPILENTVIAKETWYEGVNQVTQSTVNSDCGYDSCRYTMDIRMTTVQATTAAVEQVYSNGYYEEVVDYLAHNVANEGVYDATALEKTLTIAYDGSSGSPSNELYPLEPSLAKTGDQTRTYLLAGLAALSACLLAATAVVWKKTGS